MDRAEATGFGVSLVGHGALLLAAWLIVSRPVPTQVSEAFEVSYVDEVGLTSASPEPAPSAMASVAPEVAPPEQAAPEPVPEPIAEPTPTPQRAAPRPAPSPERATAPARPTPPRTNRQQGTAAARRTTGSLLGNDILRGIGNDRNARTNRAQAVTYGPSERVSVRQAIARALMRCQRQTLPAPEAAAIRVDYNITLNADGSLGSAQFVRVLNDDPSLERYERRMRDIALNVINACTPIRGLPPEFYDVPGGWRQFPYRFNPRTVR